LREKPDEDTIKAIYQAWLDHLVLVFPGQTLSQEDLLRVTTYFGQPGNLDRPAKYHPPGFSRMRFSMRPTRAASFTFNSITPSIRLLRFSSRRSRRTATAGSCFACCHPRGFDDRFGA